MYTRMFDGTIMKIVAIGETVSFPSDESNPLYQEYLQWVSDGNVADYFPSPQEAMEMLNGNQ